MEFACRSAQGNVAFRLNLQACIPMRDAGTIEYGNTSRADMQRYTVASEVAPSAASVGVIVLKIVRVILIRGVGLVRPRLIAAARTAWPAHRAACLNLVVTRHAVLPQSNAHPAPWLHREGTQHNSVTSLSHPDGRPPPARQPGRESCAPVRGVVPGRAGARGWGAAAPILAREVGIQVLTGRGVRQHAVRLDDALEQPVRAVPHPRLRLRTSGRTASRCLCSVRSHCPLPFSRSHRIRQVVLLTIDALAAQVRSLIACIAPCRLQAPREFLLRHA